jgi:cyclophilin family peptidyl-prolyl cis-trans isomerase
VRRVAALTALLITAVVGCGGGTETSAIPSGGDAPPAASTTAAAAAPAGCKSVEQPKPKPDGGQSKPSAKLDPATTYVATVKTNCGTFAFRLDVRRAPNAAASLAVLAKKGFFDGTIFHRIVSGFVIQGGDPTGSGTGGPGYKTEDKPPAGTEYTKGVVAMAKGPSEPAGTAGSQFFVVSGDASRLTPDYAVVGKVVKGLDVVERIGELGDAAEKPTAVVVVQSFRVAPA